MSCEGIVSLEIWNFSFFSFFFTFFMCVLVCAFWSMIYNCTKFEGTSQWHCEKSPMCLQHTFLLSAIFLATDKEIWWPLFTLIFPNWRLAAPLYRYKGIGSHTMADKCIFRLEENNWMFSFYCQGSLPFSTHNDYRNEPTRSWSMETNHHETHLTNSSIVWIINNMCLFVVLFIATVSKKAPATLIIISRT